MTLKEISSALKEGRFTSKDLVLSSLKAISENDSAGRGLNCIAELNPDVLFEAEHADSEISSGNWKGPLHGVPVLLKDNIDVEKECTPPQALWPFLT